MAEEKPDLITMAVEEGNKNSLEYPEKQDVVRKVHADGHVDLVDAHAIGGNFEEMPKGYFWTPQFVGTVIVCALLS
jgi:hypothetical protein